MESDPHLNEAMSVPAGEVRAALARIAPAACPGCNNENGAAGVVSDPDDINKVAVFPHSPVGHDLFIPAYLTVCQQCGFVSSFACEQVMQEITRQRGATGNG